MLDLETLAETDRDGIDNAVRDAESTDDLEECVRFAQDLRSAAIGEIKRRNDRHYADTDADS